MRYRTARSTSERAAPGLRERHIRGVMDATQDSYSASTRRNYEGAWRLFARWAGGEGLSALPAKPETVGAYLAERAADGCHPHRSAWTAPRSATTTRKPDTRIRPTTKASGA